MKYKIDLDLNGHLIGLEGSWDTHEEVLSYLHQWYHSYKDLKVYIMEYGNGLEEDPTFGSPYKYNLSTYYSCEAGVYHEDQYNDIDEGRGLIEIGSTYLVNNDLLPKTMKDDSELLELALEKWLSLHYETIPPKPVWLV